MMSLRVALFSDIHGNNLGLRAILDHLQAQGGADVIIAAGDLVAGGPGGDEIIELLLENEVRMLRGNHEVLAVDPEAYFQRIPEQWLDWAQCDADWLQENLSPAYWDLLAELPLSRSVEFDNGKKLFACHAAPDDPWAYVCAQDVPQDVLKSTFGELDADVIAYGHMHKHHLLWMDSKMLLNVASVGLRPDGLSAYTLLESVDGCWVVQQFQVPYDAAEEARLIQVRGVPMP
jgi:predicted phosphodiesterase